MLCDGTNKLPPIYVAYTRDGAFERLNIVRDEKTGQLRGGYVPVAQEHIDGICAKGQAISAAPKPLSAEGEGTKVYTSYTLPSSFTIATYYGIILGNFWVPGNMPSGHEAHLAQFDMVANYFGNATRGVHFANSLLTQANWTTNHTGKGMIFGRHANGVHGIAGTGTTWSPVSQSYITCDQRSAVVETWHTNPNASPPSLGNYVWNASMNPNTCSPDFYYDNQKYTVLNGANIYQESTYWLYNYGSSTPFFMADTVSSWHYAFQSGYAGIAFLVASHPSYPLPTSEYWSLSFTNVVQWTQ